MGQENARTVLETIAAAGTHFVKATHAINAELSDCPSWCQVLRMIGHLYLPQMMMSVLGSSALPRAITA